MRFALVTTLASVLSLLSQGRAYPAIVADLIDTSFTTSSAAGNSVFDAATLTVFIDPDSTHWMALSRLSDLSIDLPNLTGIPTIASTQTDDAILLTASIGAASSPTIVLDDNNFLNQRIGNQAIYFGSFSSVGSFNGSQYGAQAETGALTAFFDTHGAGTYTLSVSFLNRFSAFASHPDVYLLRDVEPAPAVPEPSSMLLWSVASLTLAGLGWRRKKRAT